MPSSVAANLGSGNRPAEGPVLQQARRPGAGGLWPPAPGAWSAAANEQAGIARVNRSVRIRGGQESGPVSREKLFTRISVLSWAILVLIHTRCEPIPKTSRQ